MRYLIDTNVLSEVMRPVPDPTVLKWLASVPPLDQAISVLSLGEIEKGIQLLPGAATKRAGLALWLQNDLPRQFSGRVLEVTEAVAVAWGQLAAVGQQNGRALPVIDGLLLATAKANGLTLATRNVSDTVGRGVPVFDPWTGTLHS